MTVRFAGPRLVDLAPYQPAPMLPGHLRVRTLYSGISAGTELTAYRGSNPYLKKKWDKERRLFIDGTQTFTYPVSGWGYSEVGEVVDLADDVDPAESPRLGEVVWGVWGHRSDAVLPVADYRRRVLPTSVDPLYGVFGRVGAVAYNAVVAAEVHVADAVAIFGQGVLGLLATRLTTLNGGRVIAVDTLPPRLALAVVFGARHTLDAREGQVAEHIKEWSRGFGADEAIEISGSYQALHEAVRCTGVGGRVIAAGFYQGEGVGLRLGEEFHHNRVRIVASQIGGPAPNVLGRWSIERLQQTFMELVAEGEVDVAPLVSHVIPVDRVAEAFRLLDERPSEALQVVLDFRDVTAGAS